MRESHDDTCPPQLHPRHNGGHPDDTSDELDASEDIKKEIDPIGVAVQSSH
jgi:hypothetical protein